MKAAPGTLLSWPESSCRCALSFGLAAGRIALQGTGGRHGRSSCDCADLCAVFSFGLPAVRIDSKKQQQQATGASNSNKQQQQTTATSSSSKQQTTATSNSKRQQQQATAASNSKKHQQQTTAASNSGKQQQQATVTDNSNKQQQQATNNSSKQQ